MTLLFKLNQECCICCILRYDLVALAPLIMSALHRRHLAAHVADLTAGSLTHWIPGCVQALLSVSERKVGCPFGTPDEQTMQWFLRDRKFDVDETVSKLEKMMKWRQEFK